MDEWEDNVIIDPHDSDKDRIKNDEGPMYSAGSSYCEENYRDNKSRFGFGRVEMIQHLRDGNKRNRKIGEEVQAR